MTMWIILYIVAGVLTAFTASVIVRVYKWTDEIGMVLYPLSGLLFPAVIAPITVLVLFVMAMDNLAESVADRIRNRNI